MNKIKEKKRELEKILSREAILSGLTFAVPYPTEYANKIKKELSDLTGEIIPLSD